MPPCKTGEFRCNDGKCIAEAKKCDKEYDCTEGEDELGCREYLLLYLTTILPALCIDYIALK